MVKTTIAISALLLATTTLFAQLAINEYPVPTAASSPEGMAPGPDGNLWFTEGNGNKIGKITITGAITEFPVPTSGSYPIEITAGPDGNLWFTEYEGSKIGRITTAGVITEFSTGLTSGSFPRGITAGPDGNLWFTEQLASKIGRITTSGVITEFPLAGGRSPIGITSGPDGNLWFAEYSGNSIGKINTAGAGIVEFPTPTSGSSPAKITPGPDGNLWFTEYNGNMIGKITTAGGITEFPVPTGASQPLYIVAGPDGNLWFTEFRGNNIGRISTAGTISEFPVPTPASGPNGMAAGQDGNVWFNEYYGNKIGKVVLPGKAFQARYFANLGAGDSYIYLSNDGSFVTQDSAGSTTRNLCVNVYTFDANEEMISCCTCPITPNGLKSLSVKNDLVSNTLTPGVPLAVVVELVATTQVFTTTNGSTALTTNCDATIPPDSGLLSGEQTSRVGAMHAWGTAPHLNSSSGAYSLTETEFSHAALGRTELSNLTQTCGFINSVGSGFGICKSCQVRGLGAGQE